MSFEELQKKWGDQFTGSSRDENSLTEIELLARIRRAERGFRYTVILLALRDLVMLALLLRVLRDVLGHGGQHLTPEMIRHHRKIGLMEFGVVIALSLPLARFRPQWARLTPSAAEGRTVLPGRIRKDGRRFNAMILWRDLREIAAGIFVIFVAMLGASRTQNYRGLAWTAVVLFAAATVSFLVFRLRTQANRPPVDDTILGTLTVSIYHTRRQVRLLDNLWWYIMPLMLGGLLMGPLRVLLGTREMHRDQQVWTAVFGAMCWGTWRLNRWVARSRLRPRLEQLEKLKADLSTDEPAAKS